MIIQNSHKMLSRKLSSILVVLVSILYSHKLTLCTGQGFCGLARYDLRITNRTYGNRNFDPKHYEAYKRYYNKFVPEMFRKKLKPPSDFVINNHANRGMAGQPLDNSWVQRRAERLRRLAQEPFPVRVRAFYDSSVEAEFDNNQNLHNYLRNLILNAQLIYEQPELYNSVKLYFVVVQLGKLVREYTYDMSAEDMLKNINEFQGNTVSDDFDVTFMFFGQNIKIDRKEKSGRLVGLATLGSFCNKNLRRALLLNSRSLGNAVVLAHEFAHSLDVGHDGQPDYFEGKCDKNSNIMSPTTGPDKLRWSSCSMQAMQYFLTDDDIYKCVYNEARLSRARPVNTLFDFKPTSTTGVELQRPGELLSLDNQCQLAIDRPIQSMLGVSPKGFTVCQLLFCRVDGDFVNIGPAAAGSSCISASSQSGKCKHGDCVV